MTTGPDSIQILDRAMREMLDEYQRTGRVNLQPYVAANPKLANELLEFALWIETPADDLPDYLVDGSLCDVALNRKLDREERTPQRDDAENWTHPSVIRLAEGRDPIDVIVKRAREIVMKATDLGWSGPPFDPILLAELLGLKVRANHNLRDARVLLDEDSTFQIEYNPNRPQGRIRYSLAHEIVHTFFPDCGDYVRNRVARAEMQTDEWQLEMLCNIGAAELLMPIGSMPHLSEDRLSLDYVLDYRTTHKVSMEAVLIRVARTADLPCAAFCCTRVESGANTGRYRLDYAIPSSSWNGVQLKSMILPPSPGLAECSSIGHTWKFTERWVETLGDFYIEGVGIPPYPGSSFPRVAGLLFPKEMEPDEEPIKYLKGDATSPRGSGIKIIAHIVNDGTPRWGGGFALAVRKKWPEIQDEFIAWVSEDRRRLTLGAIHEATIDEDCSIVHMVAQKGYGPADAPRLRYAPLQECLNKLWSLAITRDASVHMPRIGSGQAGGNWDLIEELIRSTLGDRKIPITVYDLPDRKQPLKQQIALDM